MTSINQLIYKNVEAPVCINEQGLWNATSLVRAYNLSTGKEKKLGNWLQTDSAKELIDILREGRKTAIDIPSDFQPLVETKAGNPLENPASGTWINEDLVLPLAHWLSPEFYIWCNRKFKELIEAEKEIANETRRERFTNCAITNQIVAKDLETGKVFLINNLKKWIKEKGIKSCGNIYAVLNEKRLSAYGFNFWKLDACPVQIVNELDPNL